MSIRQLAWTVYVEDATNALRGTVQKRALPTFGQPLKLHARGFINNMSCNPFGRLKSLSIIFIFLITSQLNAQDIKIYKTDQLGIKNITPSIIIDENSMTGEYKVYSINEFGLRNIHPDEIIENDKYGGTWKVYRVNNLGLKDIVPVKITEENLFDDSVKIYDVNNIGLKDISPSTIIEKDSFSGNLKLYNVNSMGLKAISPFEVIKREGNKYNVYLVNKMGLPDIAPKRVIEIKDNPTVFGILLLPSIKQIKFEPGHTSLKTIQRIKATPEKMLKEDGWLQSNPKSK